MKFAVQFGSGSRRPGRRQAGYALLMVVFLGAVMAVAVAAVAPNVLTQGIREKEEEMIWRGKQYTRAVKLFYRKNGRFPASIEDLEKKRTTVRYLRQAYKDPMNSEDGSWRLIYGGPGGQLIGSVTKTGAIQFPTTPGAAQQPGQAAPVGQVRLLCSPWRQDQQLLYSVRVFVWSQQCQASARQPHDSNSAD